MLSTEVMIKLTFLVSVAAILDMLNLLINRLKYIRANPLGRFIMSFYIYKGCFIYVPTMLSTEVMKTINFSRFGGGHIGFVKFKD